MKYFKLYKQGIIFSVLYFFIYILVLGITLFIIFPPEQRNIANFERYFSFSLTAIYMTFFVLNVPMQRNLLYEFSLGVLLPLKKWQIIVARYLKDLLLLLLFNTFSVSLISIIEKTNSYLFDQNLCESFFFYISVELVMLFSLEPIFIVFSNLEAIEQKRGSIKTLVFISYLLTPYITNIPVYLIYQTPFIDKIGFNIPSAHVILSFVYVAVLLAVSLVASFKIFSKNKI